MALSLCINGSIECPVSNEEDQILSPSLIFHSSIGVIIKALLTMLILANVLATTTKRNHNNVLACFDVRRNLSSLVKRPESTKIIFIDRWKVTYMLICHILHCFKPLTLYTSSSIEDFYSSQSQTSAIVRYMFASIPTSISYNFMITGILSMYNWYLPMKRGKLSFSLYVTLRALASLPIVLFMISVYIILPDCIGNTSSIRRWANSRSRICYSNGWWELLFISNYFPSLQQCNVVSWFASANMQLYIMSYPLQVLFARSSQEKVKLLTVIALTLVSGVPCFLFLTSHLSTYREFLKSATDHLKDPQQLDSIYFNVIQYIPAYMIGLWMGYKMACGHRWSPAGANSNLLLLSSLAVLYAPAVVYDVNFVQTLSDTRMAVMWTIQRFIFNAMIGACIFASWSRQATTVTIIDRVHSTLSKMQYCYFLIHPLVISFIGLQLDDVFTSHTWFLSILFASSIIVSLFLTLLVHVAVEKPFHRLLALSMKRKTE